MLNRRNMLSNTTAFLFSLVLPKIVQSEVKSIDSSDKIIHEMSNGIEKIFNRTIINSKRLDYTSFHIKNIDISFPINLHGNVNDDAWHTILAAASDATDNFKFPISECSQFLKTRATDVFVDDKAFRFFKHIYEEDELPISYKIHSVNLRQYYDFYTKNLRKKFHRYHGNLFIAADLCNKCIRPFICSNSSNMNEYGCVVPDNFCFRIGQI